jgi:hypothetical protein
MRAPAHEPAQGTPGAATRKPGEGLCGAPDFRLPGFRFLRENLLAWSHPSRGVFGFRTGRAGSLPGLSFQQ